MTIDLKWLLPFVMPFAVMALVRVLWFVAGAEWAEPAMAAFFSLIVGGVVGVIGVGFLDIDGIRWNVTIGRGQK